MTNSELENKKREIQDLFKLLNNDISIYQVSGGNDQLLIFLNDFKHDLQGLKMRFDSLSLELSK